MICAKIIIIFMHLVYHQLMFPLFFPNFLLLFVLNERFLIWFWSRLFIFTFIIYIWIRYFVCIIKRAFFQLCHAIINDEDLLFIHIPMMNWLMTVKDVESNSFLQIFAHIVQIPTIQEYNTLIIASTTSYCFAHFHVPRYWDHFERQVFSVQ